VKAKIIGSLGTRRVNGRSSSRGSIVKLNIVKGCSSQWEKLGTYFWKSRGMFDCEENKFRPPIST